MLKPIAASLLLATLGASAPAPEPLHLLLTGLRSAEGSVRLCVWSEGEGFPDCRRHQPARKLHAPAAATVRIEVPSLPPGAYAVSAFHDENDNRVLDKSFVGIPTEGFGFSRNPRVTFGPPKFGAASFDAAPGTTQEIRLRYML